MRKRNIIIIFIVTTVILLIPLIAMQFTNEVDWNLFDFIVMGVLILGTGLTYEFARSKGSNTTYKFAVGVALGTSFLLVWMNGAVGIIGNENNPANLLYFGVLAIGLIGAIIARLKPSGMSRVLFATALAQALVPVIALLIWKPAFSLGVLAVFVLNTFFVIMFILSALLFKSASKTN